MAIDLLSMPPMSAESERVFSGARRTITWERHSLGCEVVEQSECLKSWIRLLIKDGEVSIDPLLAQQVLEAPEEEAGQDGTILTSLDELGLTTLLPS
jgi:hypothetical protein